MAELDVAGGLALERANALLAGVDAVEARLAEARERLARAVSDSEAEWSRLGGLAAEAAAEIAAESQDLFGEGTQAQEALLQLRGSYERLATEAAEEKERIGEELEAFAGRLREVDPALQKALAEAEQAAGGLRERAEAVEGELKQVLAETDAALHDDLAEELRELEEGIRQRTEALWAFLEGEAVPTVNAAVEELLAQLQGAEASVREALEAAERTVAEGAESAVEEVATGHEQALTELADLGTSLEELLHKLNALAEDGGAAVQKDGEALNEVGREAQESLNATLGLVRDVEETLRRYSFVHF
jgi:ABC-type transporter Mla subunit MlaD